jgi:hypothetical protein
VLPNDLLVRYKDIKHKLYCFHLNKQASSTCVLITTTTKGLKKTLEAITGKPSVDLLQKTAIL